MKVLIIIPAYNEAENIEHVVTTLKRECPFADYIIVNDCSKDATEKICKKNGYNFLSLPINLGIGGGVQAGYKYALANDYDYAVQFDGDGQHNAEYIKDLIETLENGEADMAIGSRFIKKEGFQTSTMRRFGINILKIAIKLCTGVTATDATSGFRAANKEVTKFFANQYAQDYPEPEAIVSASRHGFKIKDIPVVMNERTAGVSSINPMKSVYYMIKVLLSIFIMSLTNKKGR